MTRTSRLPWLLAAKPLLAAFHAGCGAENDDTAATYDAGDASLCDGTECPDVAADDGSRTSSR